MTSLRSQVKKQRINAVTKTYLHVRPSLLFDGREASKIQTIDLYQLALTGLQNLINMEPKLNDFKETVFNGDSVSFERGLQTVDSLQTISALLDTVLCLIAPYFLLKAAHQVLEYLIRVYEINDYNIEAYMACILPYHNTNLFVRAVQIVNLKKHQKWNFLKGAQAKGKAVDRTFLIKTATANIWFWEKLCAMVGIAVENDASYPTLFSFYSALMVGCFAIGSDPDMLKRVYKHLKRGFSSRNLQYQIATHIIWCCIVSKNAQALTPNFLNKALNTMVSKASHVLKEKALLSVALTFNFQDLSEVSPEFIAIMLKWKELPKYLFNLESNNHNLSAFMRNFLGCLTSNTISDENALSMMTSILTSVPVEQSVAQQLIMKLIRTYNAEFETIEEPEHKVNFKVLLLRLDAKYPTAFGNVVDELINSDSNINEAAWGELFSETKYHIIFSQVDSVFTLFSALKADSSVTVLNKSIDYIASLGEQVMTENDLLGLVQTRISDLLNENSDRTVLVKVLKNKSLISLLNKEELANQCFALFHATDSSEVKLHLIKVIITLLDEAICREKFLTIIFANLTYSHQNTKAISDLCIKATSSYDNPLFRGLMSDNSPEARADALIQSLSNNIASYFDALEPTLERLMKDEKTFPFLFLVLNHTIQNSSSAQIAYFLSHWVRFYIEEKSFNRPSVGVEIDWATLFRANKNFNSVFATLLNNIVMNMIHRTPSLEKKDQDSVLHTLFVLITTDLHFLAKYSMHIAAITKLYNVNFPQFLSQFWSTNYSTIVSVRSFTLFYTMLQGLNPTSMISIIEVMPKYIIPLLSSLGSTSEEVRTLAFCSLQVLKPHLEKVDMLTTANSEIPSSEIQALCQIMNSQKSDIRKEKFDLVSFLEQKFMGKNGEKNEELIHFLVYSALNCDAPFFQKDFLKILIFNQSKAIFSDAFEFLMTKLNELFFKQKIATFDESEVITTLLCTLTPATVPFLNKNQQYIDFLGYCLEFPEGLEIKGSNRYFYPQLVLFKQFSSEFFSALNQKNQAEMFRRITVMYSNSLQKISSEMKKVVKSLTIPPHIIQQELMNLCLRANPIPVDEMPKKKVQKVTQKKNEVSPGPTQLTTDLTHLLSLFKAKKDLLTPVHAKPLFELLSFFVDPESILSQDESSDYLGQLILSCLTSITEAVAKNQSEKAISEMRNDYNIKIVVAYLHGSNNPTIHNACLVLLGVSASVYPDKVFDNIMPIFTSFMGSSNNPMSDDEYSFRVIQKTIKKIIPAVVKEGGVAETAEIIRTFVNSIHDIPIHRRSILFTRLLTTLGPDYIPFFMLFMFGKEKERKFRPNFMTRNLEAENFFLLEFTLELCLKFSALDIIFSIISVVSALFLEDEEELHADLKILKALAPAADTSDLQIVLEFLEQLLDVNQYLEKLMELGEAELEFIQSAFIMLFNFLVEILITQDVTESNQLNNLTLVVLSKLNALLSVDNFIELITGLLSSAEPAIRTHGLTILNSKLGKINKIEERFAIMFLNMTPQLVALITEEDEDSDSENDEMKQTAASSIQLLTDLFGYKKKYSEKFLELIDPFIGALETGSSSNQVKSSIIITIATICSALGPMILPFINKLIPCLMNSFSMPTDRLLKKAEFQLIISTLTSIEVIVKNSGRYITSSIEEIIRVALHPRLVNSQKYSSTLKDKLYSLFKLVAVSMKSEILFVPIRNCYFGLLELADTWSISGSVCILMEFVGYIMQKFNSEEFKKGYKQCLGILTSAFSFRETITNAGQKEDIFEVEKQIIKTFNILLMKMNETVFNQVFLVLMEWAEVTREAHEINMNKALFFYHLISSISDQLKNIFVPYFQRLLPQMIDVLNSIEVKHLSGNHKGKKIQYDDMALTEHEFLLTWIMKCLSSCFIYDTVKFVSKEIYDSLLEPIMRQLEIVNHKGTDVYSYRMEKQVVPCIVDLAVNVGNEPMWKPLNYTLLQLTTNEDPQIRFFSVFTLYQLYERIGEEYQALLPESMQYISGLLEDSDTKVELLVKKLTRKLGELVGGESTLLELLR